VMFYAILYAIKRPRKKLPITGRFEMNGVRLFNAVPR